MKLPVVARPAVIAAARLRESARAEPVGLSASRFDCAINVYNLYGRRRSARFSRMKSASRKRTPNIVNLTVKRRYLTEREVERLMNCARKHGRYGHRDATMILFDHRQGLRASEVCDLQWQQIELADSSRTFPEVREVPTRSQIGTRRINLLGLDAGRLDDRIPLLDLSPVEGSESGWRQPLRRRHLHAKVGDALVRIWIGHCGESSSVHLGDDISRRVLRRPKTEPGADLDARKYFLY